MELYEIVREKTTEIIQVNIFNIIHLQARYARVEAAQPTTHFVIGFTP
jgi:hypothetical protein